MKNVLLIVCVLALFALFGPGCGKTVTQAGTSAEKTMQEPEGENNDSDDGEDTDDGDDEEEVKVDPADLPQAVKDAVSAEYPGVKITEAEKEIEDGKTVYEVEIKKDGREIDIELSADGTILKEETGDDDDDDD